MSQNWTLHEIFRIQVLLVGLKRLQSLPFLRLCSLLCIRLITLVFGPKLKKTEPKANEELAKTQKRKQSKQEWNQQPPKGGGSTLSEERAPTR